MLDPARLSAQTRRLLQSEGLKAGLRTDKPLGAPELKALLKAVDTDANGQLSQAEAQKAKIPASDRALINEALKARQGNSQPVLDLNIDDFDLRFGETLAAAIAESTPKSGPGPSPFSAPAPPPAPTPRILGNDTISLESRPELKPNQNPSRDGVQTLDKLTFHGQGHFGPVSLGSDIQLDPAGQPVGGSTSLSLSAAPALKLGARLDTRPVLEGELPAQVELTGEGSLSSLSYSTGATYGEQGLSATRGSLGLKLADSLSVGVAGSQQLTPEGLAIKDVGLTTSHQFGALSLGSKLNLDALSGKPSAGASLGYQVAPTARLDLNGESDGLVSKLGFSFKSTF